MNEHNENDDDYYKKILFYVRLCTVVFWLIFSLYAEGAISGEIRPFSEQYLNPHNYMKSEFGYNIGWIIGQISKDIAFLYVNFVFISFSVKKFYDLTKKYR